MKRLLVAIVAYCVLGRPLTGASLPTPSPSSGLPSIGSSVALKFQTSVQALDKTATTSGTVTIARTGASALAVTVAPDGGTAQTLHLLLHGDGSYEPDPAFPPPVAAAGSDPQQKAAAKALFGRLALAAKIASSVRRLKGNGEFDVPYDLTPIGDSSPVPVTIHMAPSASSNGIVYQGATDGSSTTVLPPSAMGESKNQKLKTAGASALIGVAIAPVVGLATHIAMRLKTKSEKKALSRPLPVTTQLLINSHFTPGPSAQISGVQYDTISVNGQSSTIITNWTFSTP